MERDSLPLAPHSVRSIAVISIPYTYIAISFCLLVGFFKLGDLDEEIGWGLGLGTGIVVLVLNHFFPGGYLGLGLYAVGGFVLLTAYKVIRGMPKTQSHKHEEDVEQRD